MATLLVTGVIRLPSHNPLPPSAVIYVHLLDTSLADAPAILISEQVIENAAAKVENDGKIKFALYGELHDFKANYTVSVHVDLDNDGQISQGDYVNVESYPVITFGYPTAIEVKTVKVT